MKKRSTEIISDGMMESCIIMNTKNTSEVPILPEGFSTFECKLCSRINIININGQENINFKCKGCSKEFSANNRERNQNHEIKAMKEEIEKKTNINENYFQHGLKVRQFVHKETSDEETTHTACSSF